MLSFISSNFSFLCLSFISKYASVDTFACKILFCVLFLSVNIFFCNPILSIAIFLASIGIFREIFTFLVLFSLFSTVILLIHLTGLSISADSCVMFSSFVRLTCVLFSIVSLSNEADILLLILLMVKGICIECIRPFVTFKPEQHSSDSGVRFWPFVISSLLLSSSLVFSSIGLSVLSGISIIPRFLSLSMLLLMFSSVMLYAYFSYI